MNIHKIVPFINFTSNDTFRDDELFDDKKDKIHNGYRTYDYNDYPVKKKRVDFLPNEYVSLYNLVEYPKVPIDTSNVLNDIECIGGVTYTKPNKKTLNQKLHDACLLKGRKKYTFSRPLYDFLVSKRDTGDYSTRELIDITNASKMKKANLCEYVDFDLIDAGLYCVDRFPSNNNTEAKQLTRLFIVKDEDGNEVFSKKIFDFVKNLKNINNSDIEDLT